MLIPLTVSERFALLDLLPQEGDLATLRVVRQLREKLSFSEAEFEKFQMRGVFVCETDDKEYALELPVLILPQCEICHKPLRGQSTRWNPEVDQVAELELTEKQQKIIATALETLSKNKKLTENFLPLCDKFLKED